MIASPSLTTVDRGPSSGSINRVGVFNAFVGADMHSSERITVGPGTFADVSFISPARVDPAWEVVSLPPLKVTGIGGPAPPVTRAVKIPLRLQWGAPLTCVYAYVSEPPQSVDLLMGCDQLDFLQASVNRAASRVEFMRDKTVVQLDKGSTPQGEKT